MLITKGEVHIDFFRLVPDIVCSKSGRAIKHYLKELKSLGLVAQWFIQWRDHKVLWCHSPGVVGRGEHRDWFFLLLEVSLKVMLINTQMIFF